ncbi:MAG: hypothetical protein N2117_09215 [Anaerolineales bacterium]|nr:hypothetical protein [Anaerolineales bacterium]MCX7755410.1 hypothetical protein [Anaerolineales bacterium]MDW8278598.1 hypothetical protein [Anaerolineales bacterium]
MNIRPLDLLDLPTLYRYRGEALSLDTARLLTRGNPLGAIGLMAYLNPDRHIYSAVASDDGVKLLGGISQSNGESFAKLLYLAPTAHLTHTALPALIEHLTTEAGAWGSFHVLAEVEETSQAFAALRLAGFSVYAWQRVWDLSAVEGQDMADHWHKVSGANLPAVQLLHHQIVPPLLQAIEPAPRRTGGWICPEGGRCYVGVASGVYGVLLTPLIHPEASDVAQKFVSLLKHLPERRNRPVYVCVRSYQAWLEPVLEDLGAKASPRQAVMVKHLTRVIKEEEALTRAAQPATAIPASRVSHIETKEPGATP